MLKLRKEMTQRMLGNGYCARPVEMDCHFESATKGLAERLRQMGGSTSDGAELVDVCFSGKQRTPVIIRINAYVTKSEISEHQGFSNLLKGIFGTFRNPVAHAPRTAWSVSEAAALDLFSTLSYLHRRLDGAKVATV